MRNGLALRRLQSIAVAAAALVALGRGRADEPAPLTKPPRLVRFIEAEAPPRLAELGRVDVILTIDIDAAGSVTAVAVAQSAGEDFDAAAVAAARQFAFEPGEAGGRNVPVRITYRYRFVAKPEPADAGPPGAPATEPAADVPAADQVERSQPPAPAAGVGPRGDGRYTSTVRGEHVASETVEHTLQVEEIQRIPGTQGDTLKAIQSLPGVARAPYGLGLLVVWGSAPVDTRTYVDGVYIPTLYHFGGLRSTVNSEMIQSLDFLPGGYSVDHGLGLGGVVDVATRVPRRDALHGYAQIDVLDGSVGLEGPLGRDVDFAVSARRSWIDAFLPLFTSADFQLSPAYYDYQARLVYRPTPRDDLSFVVFGSDDNVTLLTTQPDPNLSAQYDSHTYYHRGIVSWLHRFAGGATLSLTTSAGYDVPFQVSYARANSTGHVDAQTLAYGARLAARVPLASWLRLDAGVDFEGNRWTIDREAPLVDPMMHANGDSAVAADDFTVYTNHAAPFASLAFSLFDHKLTIDPQFRLALMTFSGYPGEPQSFSSTFARPEPRLSLRYQLTPEVALKASFGLYDQPPQPQDLSAVFGNPKLSPELAYHYVAGVDVRVTPSLTLSLEGFYKDLRNLVVAGEHAGDPLRVNDGIGRVYGGEILVRQELWKGFFGWISYTLSRSERRDHPDEDWHVFQYDQTHILNLMASYQLGCGYQLGLRYRYVTGNPTTPVAASYFDSNLNQYVGVMGPAYSTRLGPFSQLDLRFDKTWTFDQWRLSLYLDVQNVTNSANPEGVTYNFDYSRNATVNGLPILPVLGVRGEF